MKYTLLFCLIATSLCFADQPLTGRSKTEPSEIRKEHEEKKDSHGKVNCYVDTVYRGKERVLATVKLLEKNKYGMRMTRAYFSNGKDVVDEIYYDDGTEIIRLYNDGILNEMFRRQTDGSVEPVSSEELAELKSKQQEIIRTFKQ